MDSAFMAKQTRHNYTLGNQQQYTHTIMWKILTLVTDSAFMAKQTRHNYTLGNQQQYTCTIM